MATARAHNGVLNATSFLGTAIVQVTGDLLLGQVGTGIGFPSVLSSIVASFGAGTITRTDNGNFLTDGFQPGMTLQVAGTSANATLPGQAYFVTGVSATVLTLSLVPGTQLTTETGKAVTLTGTTLYTAFLSAPTGNIFNALASGPNVISGRTFLFANVDIGAQAKPITAQVGFVEGQSTTGSTWLDNTGALAVGGVTSASTALTAGGSINITAHSPVTVSENVIAKDDILIWAKDSNGAEGNPDNITVNSGVTINSQGLVTPQTGSVTSYTGNGIAGVSDTLVINGSVPYSSAAKLVGETIAIASGPGAGLSWLITNAVQGSGNTWTLTVLNPLNPLPGLPTSASTYTFTGGHVTLLAGDNVSVPVGATVLAAKSITIAGDYQILNGDTTGTNISLKGTLTPRKSKWTAAPMPTASPST